MSKSNFCPEMKRRRFYIIFFLLIVLSYQIVFAVPPRYLVSKTTSYLSEDLNPIFYFNFSNISIDDENDTRFYNIVSIDSSLYGNSSYTSFYSSWIQINENTGIFTLNSSRDNQTGRFNISIFVNEHFPEVAGTTDTFYFIVNATNDAPRFINLNTAYNITYNLTDSVPFSRFLNASDEERHYPLIFNLTFQSCILANWSVRTNCTLFEINVRSNTSVLMNYTPTFNDVGVYYANVSVRDSGQNYNCTTGACELNYSTNRTNYYTELVAFNVFTTLGINSSDCQNKTFNESQFSSCVIHITTKGVNDLLNLTTRASVKSMSANVSNIRWFYPDTMTNAQNFYKDVAINFTPGKTEIGNWTINFSVFDVPENITLLELISVYINRTSNDVPRLSSISNVNTSTNYINTINFTAYDDDFLIPDKINGYNESLNFSVKFYNYSDQTYEKTINGYSLSVLSMPVDKTNRSTIRIVINPQIEDAGEYLVNVSARDRDGYYVVRLFNLSIFTNNPPIWLEPMNRTQILYENVLSTRNLTKNATDPDGSQLTFSYTNDTSFYSFNLNSNGVFAFTATDRDIGQHLVNVTISDGFLENSTIFNFTVYNVNDAPSIETPFIIVDGSINSTTLHITAIEDNLTQIIVWIQDDDLLVPQKDFYNETLNVSLIIIGNNSKLFNFTQNPDPLFNGLTDGRVQFVASFIANKSDLGEYQITMVVSDNNWTNDTIYFNMTVLEYNHPPIISNISNFTFIVGDNLYYIFNASDFEDGVTNYTEGNPNLTFSYSFITGNDFINTSQEIFNTTSGIFDFTFDSNSSGKYNLNITINDSKNVSGSFDFWIYVYDMPSIIYPTPFMQVDLVENMSYNLTFAANHSVQDNLTFDFYYQNSTGSDVLKYSINATGDGTNNSWIFIPDYGDETFGLYRNLTMIVYPANELLVNRTGLNSSVMMNISVNNSNQDLLFQYYIADINATSPYMLALTDHYYDADAGDVHHNQTIEFIVYQYDILNFSIGNFSYNVTNWSNGSSPVIFFSASSYSITNFSILGFEHNETNYSEILRNVSSNNFTVELSVSADEEQNEPTPASGGGSSGGVGAYPVAFKIVTPGKIKDNKRLVIIPINLVNRGETIFNDITMDIYILKNQQRYSKAVINIDKEFIQQLLPMQNLSMMLSIMFPEERKGDYEIVINATSARPYYNDWAKIFLTMDETANDNSSKEDLGKYLVFTSEFIAKNPECVEIQEIIDQAKKYHEQGKDDLARQKAIEAIEACKKSISQPNLYQIKPNTPFLNLNMVLIMALLGSIILGILFYLLKRKKLGAIKNNLKDINYGD